MTVGMEYITLLQWNCIYTMKVPIYFKFDYNIVYILRNERTFC